MRRGALALGLAWIALAAAAPAPIPVELPLPDLTPLVAIAPAPIDKPPVPLPEPVMPAIVEAAPELPPPPLVRDPGVRLPTAPLGQPSCGTAERFQLFFQSTTAAVQCAKFRFQEERYEDAVTVLERASDDRDARYWLAESLFRLDRIKEADRLFVGVTREARDGLTSYASHGSGWTALRLGETARALSTFDALIPATGGASPTVAASARRGRALALSLLGRHEDARQAWTAVLEGNPAPPVAREASFWLGEALGRLGQYAAADEPLTRFARGGPHPLLGAGLLRLGWWRNAAGRHREALAAYSDLLSAPVQASDLELGYYGIVEASVGAGDTGRAREAIRSLEQRSSRLVMPALFALARSAAAKRPEEAQRLNQELLGRQLRPSQRAWVLCLEGDGLRAAGKRDDARTRYDLARRGDPTSAIGLYARLRLAQINFEFREFAQARDDLRDLLAQPAAAGLREPGLALAGEAAYYAGDYDAAIADFRRFVNEFGSHPSAPAAAVSLGWAELRRGNESEARNLFTAFARERPQSPLAADALVLAAELAAGAGDVPIALDLLGQMIDSYPDHSRADLARLNRGILLLRGGRVQEAVPLLQEYVARAPDSPQVGRARAALGAAQFRARRYAQARDEFARARTADGGSLAALGLGMASIALKQWDPAVAALGEARESGTAAVSGAAEYGLAVAALARGQREDFKKFATARAAAGGATPHLLYALATLETEQKAWSEAMEAARRLLTTFPGDATGESALARLGLAAAADKQWPVASEALSLLRTGYRQSPFLEQALLPLAEARVEAGDLAGAREPLEEFVKRAADDPRAPRAWFLLARVREEAGERPGAIEAYAHATGAPEWTPAVHLRYARLLVAERRWKEARAALDTLMTSGDPATMTEAAFYAGESHDAEGNAAAAVRYYMTAAYVAPESPFGRRALLAAGASYTALKQPDNAAIAYSKLLDQKDVPPDLAQRARDELAKLGKR